MTLVDADRFFNEQIGKERQFAIFLEPDEAISTAKEMIDIMGDDVVIWIPINADGTVVKDGRAMSKEEAKKYIGKYYGEEDGVKVYQRCLDFCKSRREDEDEEGVGRSMWLETYSRVVEEVTNRIDLLEWG